MRLIRWFGLAMAAISLFVLIKQGIDIGLSSVVGLLVDWYTATSDVMLGWVGPLLEPVLRTISPLFIDSDMLQLDLTYDPMKDAQAPFILTLALFGALSRGMTNSVSATVILAVWGLTLALVPAVIASTWITASVAYIENIYFSVVFYLAGAAMASFEPVLYIYQKRVLVVLTCSLSVVVPLLLLWDPILRLFNFDQPALLFLLLLWGGMVVVLLLAGLLATHFRHDNDAHSYFNSWLMTTPTKIALELLSIVGAAIVIAASNAGLGAIGL